MHFNIILQPTHGLQSGLLLSGFLTKLYAFLIVTLYATYPADLTLFDLTP
jgi:hypothetical protein